MIDVLELSAADWRLWRRLRRAALADAPSAFGSTLAEWSGPGDTEQRWRGRLESFPLHLVVTLGGEPVGMVSATEPGPSGAVELISLWVCLAARGCGVGDEAVRRVLSWANSHHPGAPVALSVKIDNRAARRLYERHGFVLVGPSPEDDTELLMTCSASTVPTSYR